jgi:aryl-alcohol dehydrogenase-like predicted oxidoreductase
MSNYQCPRCQERVKDWSGDNPKCGFDEEGNFLETNWNCATLNALREIAEETRVWCDDSNMAIIARSDVGHGILSWYKNRGATEDFRDSSFERGNLKFAQMLLGDIEPDDWWDDYVFNDDKE